MNVGGLTVITDFDYQGKEWATISFTANCPLPATPEGYVLSGDASLALQVWADDIYCTTPGSCLDLSFNDSSTNPFATTAAVEGIFDYKTLRGGSSAVRYGLSGYVSAFRTYQPIDPTDPETPTSIQKYECGRVGGHLYFFAQRIVQAGGGGQLTAILNNVVVTPCGGGSIACETLEPVSGEELTPSSDEFLFEPSSGSTDGWGAAYFNVIPRGENYGNAPASKMPVGVRGTAKGTIQVESAGGEKSAKQDIEAYYAVASAVSGEVFYTDALSGQRVPLTVGKKFLPGDTVILGSMKCIDAQCTMRIYPYLQLNFYNGANAKISSHVASNQTGTILRIGEIGIDGTRDLFIADASNLLYDAKYNHREYLQVVVEWGITSQLGGALAKGLKYGWVATRAVGGTIGYGFRKVMDWTFGKPKLPDLESPLYEGANSIFATASLTPFSTNISGGTDSTTLMGDGGIVAENRGSLVEITDGSGSALLPFGSAMVLNQGGSGTISGITPLQLSPESIYDYYPVELTISPADSSSLTTKRPIIAISYTSREDADHYALPETLKVRLNGTLISPRMLKEERGSKFYVTPEFSLLNGENTVEASITSNEGFISSAVASYTVDAEPSSPTGLIAYPGAATVGLKWQAQRERDVAGYNVYRSSTEDGTYSLVSPAVLTQPVFFDEAPLETGWYAVSAVDTGGKESTKSDAVQATLPPSLNPVLSEVQDVTLTPGEKQVTMDITGTPGVAGTIAWIVRRALVAGGPFQDILPVNELVGNSPFVDRTVNNGTDYWYRIVPVSYDLVEGNPFVAGPVSPLNATPSPPTGLTVEPIGTIVQLKWDPSLETDIAGYHVWRATPSQDFARITTSAVTVPSYSDNVPGQNTYAWRITSIDQDGIESLPGITETAAIIGYPGLAISPLLYNYGIEEVGGYGGFYWFHALNTGQTAITINSVVLAGDTVSYSIPPSTFYFQTDTCSGAIVPPKGQCDVAVAFNPPSVGEKTATLTFNSSDTVIPSAAVVITGRGTNEFDDVSIDFWAHDYILNMLNFDITAGCGSNNYCPDSPVTRAQMAVFILKSMGQAPAAACSGAQFADVNASMLGGGATGETFCKYIEKFASLGITSGCGNNNFCPQSNITRSQMAVFIMKALMEQPAASCMGNSFNDVNAALLGGGEMGAIFCKYIERFATLGITSGCGNGNYCPADSVSRAQMAVFLTKGFFQ
jgi:hypothetical protein